MTWTVCPTSSTSATSRCPTPSDRPDLSFIETCKINGVESFAYLKATLTAIANGHQKSRVEDLPPCNFKPSS